MEHPALEKHPLVSEGRLISVRPPLPRPALRHLRFTGPVTSTLCLKQLVSPSACTKADHTPLLSSKCNKQGKKSLPPPAPPCSPREAFKKPRSQARSSPVGLGTPGAPLYGCSPPEQGDGDGQAPSSVLQGLSAAEL